jgi:NitT/TauT family transport system permease protein
MTRLQWILAIVAGVASLAATLSAAVGGDVASAVVFAVAVGYSGLRRTLRPSLWLDAVFAVAAGYVAFTLISTPSGTLWFAVVVSWLFAWLFMDRASAAIAKGALPASIGTIIPLVFGLTLLAMWEVMVRGLGVPHVLLPAPSQIWTQLISSVPTLWADFRQTFLKGVLSGFALGTIAGLVVAVLVDRSPFLKRGLLPIGNFASALPIVGIAPIMVMWFGFDWQSKAAVIVCVTFFPMLINTLAGLNSAGRMESDVMRTYASSYWQSLFKLRLPAAMPFIFNALKVNSTLALIAAIVAEFFGTPIVGMGFRISTGAGRLDVDMVWAEVAVAAVAGSASYGLIALIERAVTFWHPSVRGGRA